MAMAVFKLNREMGTALICDFNEDLQFGTRTRAPRQRCVALSPIEESGVPQVTGVNFINNLMPCLTLATTAC